jgi:hypothetical protein
MTPPSRAAGKLAVVTGTTSGIGYAVACGLLERGWRVLGLARRPSAIEHDAYEHERVDLHDIDALDARLAPRLTRCSPIGRSRGGRSSTTPPTRRSSAPSPTSTHAASPPSSRRMSRRRSG